MSTKNNNAPANLPEQVRAIVARFQRNVEHELPKLLEAAKVAPGGFRELELRLAELGRTAVDEVSGSVIAALTGDRALEEHAVSRLRKAGRFRSPETRPATVTLLGGGTVRVQSAYVRRDLRGRRGRRRGSGKRGKAGTGHFPLLAFLGIFQGATPAASAEIVRQVADSDSIRAARSALDRRGLDLGHKQTLRVFNGVAKRAVRQRLAWLADAAAAPPVADGLLRGRRVVIATDGGRIRERVPARAGRKNKKTGHRRYDAPWREPKLLVIYVVDDDGEVLQKMRPIYDGTLGDADEVFEMFVGYLKALGAHEAKELIAVSDGAVWIWNRVPLLAERLGIAPEKVTQVIDWYHAVETLGEIAACRAKWSAKERSAWIDETKKPLYSGDIETVLERIDALSVGRGAKEIKKHRDYFARNAERMQYSSFRKRKIPIGSGAVESAVRRVINLRIKGNAKFWRESNAEGMLLIRSYLKAGRFDDLIRWDHAQSVRWWDDGTAAGRGPIPDAIS